MSKTLFTIQRKSQIEVIRGERGATLPAPRTMRDKRNDYKRHEKHKGREW